MHPLFQFIGQHTIYHPVLFDPGLALKRACDNFYPKVAFPIGPCPRMAMMLVRFINNLEGQGLESCRELGYH